MKTSIIACVVLVMTVPSIAANPKGQAAYLEGLDLLENAKWVEAREAFAKALEEDEENANFYIARGVASVFAEKFKPAMADFDRALRLDLNNKHAKLWKSATTNMQGNFMAGSEIYPQATHDQYENQIQDMARLYGEYNFRRDKGEDDPQWTKKWAADHAAAKAKFPEIARLFSARVKGSTGNIAPLLLDRAIKEIAAKDFVAAMNDLQQAAAANPNDLGIVYYRAVCNLNLGSPSAARAQFIRVLTAQSNNAEAWNGHALACAALGDLGRATASSENAASLNSDRAQAYRDALLAAVASSSATPTATKDALPGMVGDLYKLAAGTSSSDDLLKQAMAIIRATNAIRLRSDETYLDRRLRLEAATKTIPPSPGALADLGEFLYTQAVSIRGEAVEPRAVFTTYRPQTDETQQLELKLAEETLDAALRLDAKNVKALTFKAAGLIFRLRWGDAETLLKQALEVDSSYGPLLETFARVMDHAAGMKAMAAMDLRSVKSWEDANYYYYRHPSQAELQAADEYDRQAKALWELAERHLEAAAKNYAGKPLGFYYAGVLAKRRGQAEEARAAFERCVELAPDHAPAWDELTELYYAMDMKPEAASAKSAAANLQHTTSGHLLRLAWGQIVRTKYKSAQETMTKSMALDPADPRNAAYLAVIAYAKEDKPAALAWWRTAAALEEAHAQLNGVNFRSQSYEMLTADMAGRALAIHLRLGRLALEQDEAEAAVGAFTVNLTLGQRVGKLDRFRPLSSSQLPDQQTDFTIIPEADTALSLIAWSHLGLGQALQKQNREADATAQFEAVGALPAQVPPTIDPGNMLADPCILATIAMLKPLMERKEYPKAQQVARSHGHTGRPTKEYGDELRRLTSEIENKLAQNRYDEADRQAQDALDHQREELQKFLKERAEQDQRRRQNRPRNR